MAGIPSARPDSAGTSGTSGTSAREVVQVADLRRYTIAVDGQVAGFTEYSRIGRKVLFTHTEVAADLVDDLVRGALDDVRAQGLLARPLCAVVTRWVIDHPDCRDVVDPVDHDRLLVRD